jgi:predicted ArsR family transcriptional regulator
MKPVRQRILDHIREHRAATSTELSRVLNLTNADVRHHLSQLRKQGSISASGHRLTHQRGRPATLYTISASSSRNNLGLLSCALLAEVSSHYLPEKYHLFLRNIASRLTNNFEGETLNLTRRIYLAIEYLKNLNYDASWEAHSRSPRLILGHCPFATILDQHPEMCLFDSYLLEFLLGQPLKQVEKLSIVSRDLPYCVFILRDTHN